MILELHTLEKGLWRPYHVHLGTVHWLTPYGAEGEVGKELTWCNSIVSFGTGTLYVKETIDEILDMIEMKVKAVV